MNRNMLCFSISAIVVLISLSSCSSPSPAPSARAFYTVAPLSPPKYEEADIAKFDGANPFGKFDNQYQNFIFKGKVNKLYEIEMGKNIKMGKESFLVNDWLSVCEISIEKVLYGSAPHAKDVIKAVFGQSTRRLDKTAFLLKEGQEYYFITHTYNQGDKEKNDPTYDLGDVNGGVYYTLFPVNDGIVSFQGWPFNKIRTSDTNRLGEVTGTMNEKDFLDEFTAMIRDAKTQQEKPDE